MADLSTQVISFVKYKIDRLTSGSESATRAALANLRRGIGRKPGEIPQLWGEYLLDMPEAMYSQSGTGEPSYAEWAVYTALTMYALHQQGKDIHRDSMYREEQTLGMAVSRLVNGEEDRERIWRRFSSVATAADMQELSHHLRGIVQLLKAEGIPLDYALLAKDLYWFQFSERADRVKLTWGQDFYRRKKDEDGKDKGNEKE